MVKYLSNKPWHHLGDLENCYWLELAKTGKVYAYVAIKQADETANIHVEVVEWSHNIMKEALEDWQTVKRYCKQLGIKTIFVPGQKTLSSTWPRFVKLFGFSSVERILIAKQEI